MKSVFWRVNVKCNSRCQELLPIDQPLPLPHKLLREAGGRKGRAKAKVKIKASRRAKENLPVKDREKEPDPPLQEKGVVKVKRV